MFLSLADDLAEHVCSKGLWSEKLEYSYQARDWTPSTSRVFLFVLIVFFFLIFTLVFFVQFWWESFTFSLYLLAVVLCSHVLTLGSTV
jgi:hypothetical protein